MYISNFVYTRIVLGCSLGFVAAGAVAYLYFAAKPVRGGVDLGEIRVLPVMAAVP